MNTKKIAVFVGAVVFLISSLAMAVRLPKGYVRDVRREIFKQEVRHDYHLKGRRDLKIRFSTTERKLFRPSSKMPRDGRFTIIGKQGIIVKSGNLSVSIPRIANKLTVKNMRVKAEATYQKYRGWRIRE